MLNKKIAFLTEMGFVKKISRTHSNMRTEFAWMCASEATHHSIYDYENVIGYDLVVLLLPQGDVKVDCHGVEFHRKNVDKLGQLLDSNLVSTLKMNNGKVVSMQEGPVWLFNEYDLVSQFKYVNILHECDAILAHNEVDTKWFRGLFPEKPVYVLPTLLIEDLLKEIRVDINTVMEENKVIIGGNFARWYGGFQSFSVAQELNAKEIWVQESHAKRTNETLIKDLHHLPRLDWISWMKNLSSYKYAVHLMPTIAAGTFSLNCAYFGIPCIGNIKVDTQRLCHPFLSVDVDDIDAARQLAKKLYEDKDFYNKCSLEAKENYRRHYDISVWYEIFMNILQ